MPAPEAPPAPAPLARLKARVDALLHRPATDLAVVVLILLSVAALLLEVGFPRGSVARAALRDLGNAITWIFVVELSLRFWVAPKKLRFLRRYWLDLLAVLPLARPLRLLRVLLLLRLFRAGLLLNRRLSTLRGIFRGSLNEITLVATFTLTVVLVGAVTVHYWPDSVNLDVPGLEGGLWFAIFTLIAGEPTGGMPADELGRAVTLALMLSGLTVFGVFVGTVSATMVSVLSRRMEINVMELDELTGHVIVMGWNNAGPSLLRELFAPDTPPDRAVVLVTEVELPAGLSCPDDVPRERVYLHTGDYTRVEVLEAMGVQRASMAVLLCDSLIPRSDQDRDARTVLAALTIERMSPGIFCCAELLNAQHASLLKMAGVEEIVVSSWYNGLILGSVGRNHGLVTVLNDILSARSGNAFYKLTVPPRCAGWTIAALHRHLKETEGAILVSLEHTSETGAVVADVNPKPDRQVAAGDRLVVIARQPVRLQDPPRRGA